MCNYIYKELSCQHHYHLVESWCPKYIETERRCPPTILLAENANNQVNTLGPSSSNVPSHACPTLLSSAHNENDTTNDSAGQDVFCCQPSYPHANAYEKNRRLG
ncbi:hypothetical protein FCULG_00007034 [Fusarium culmorum]|uniref:Uncharacterized protein n=1 Tax=Fusarium culmorum TaxID=5516 RepID=A0A2T4GTE1_FUSCU|nr:hypothetical protein FCULG_00007034 [Fusarium culmorum]